MQCSDLAYSTQEKWSKLFNTTVAFVVLAYVLLWLRVVLYSGLLFTAPNRGVSSSFAKPVRHALIASWALSAVSMIIAMATAAAGLTSYNDKFVPENPDDLNKLKPDVAFGVFIVALVFELIGALFVFRADRGTKSLEGSTAQDVRGDMALESRAVVPRT